MPKKSKGTSKGNRHGRLSRRAVLTGLGAGLTLTSFLRGAKSDLVVTPRSLLPPPTGRDHGEKTDQPIDPKLERLCFNLDSHKLVAEGSGSSETLELKGLKQICVDFKKRLIHFECSTGK